MQGILPLGPHSLSLSDFPRGVVGVSDALGIERHWSVRAQFGAQIGYQLLSDNQSDLKATKFWDEKSERPP